MKLSLLNATAAGNLSVEEALIEMYLAGVSVRRVEDITEVLWGIKVSPEPSVISIKRHMSILKPGVHDHWLAAIRMSMLMVSI